MEEECEDEQEWRLSKNARGGSQGDFRVEEMKGRTKDGGRARKSKANWNRNQEAGGSRCRAQSTQRCRLKGR